MKEDIHNNKDINLREAIRLSEAELPQLPAGLNDRVMKRVAQKPIRRLRPWIAAAACILIIIGIGVTFFPVSQGEGPGMGAELGSAICKAKTEPEKELKTPSLPPPRVEAAPIAKHKKQLRKELQTVEEALPTDSVAVEMPVQPAHQIAATQPQTLTEEDIPITRPENYKYTPEEIALMKRQATEAYLKWVELELEIAKYNIEQTAQK